MHTHTLAKSCGAFIRSKKKCDKGSPCQRCSARGVQCRYQNEPLPMPWSQSSPRGVLIQEPHSPKVPTSKHQKLRQSRSQRRQILARTSLACKKLTEPQMLFPLEPDAFTFMVDSFRSFPVMAVEDGGNPMIHPLLYHIIDPPGTVLATNNLVRQNLHN